MAKRVSAKAKKAARAGDVASLQAELDAGKTGVDGELLQLAASHPDVVRLLLAAGADPDERVHSHDQDVVAGTFRELATMMADDGDETLLALLYGGAKEGSSRSEEAMLPGLFAMRSVALKPEGRSNERWASDLIHAVGEAFGDFYATWNGTATVKLARSETAGVLLVIDMGRPGDDDGPIDNPTIAWRYQGAETSIVASKQLRDTRVADALGIAWPARESFVQIDGVQGWGE